MKPEFQLNIQRKAHVRVAMFLNVWRGLLNNLHTTIWTWNTNNVALSPKDILHFSSFIKQTWTICTTSHLVNINFTLQLIDVTTKYQRTQMQCTVGNRNPSYAVTTVNQQLILHIDQITTNYICGKLTGKQPIMACRHHSLRSCCCRLAVPSSWRAFLASVESATNDFVMVFWGQIATFLLCSCHSVILLF